MTKPFFLPTIAGAGGSGKGGKSGSGGGVEAPNSLKSRQIARVVDLVSEGPIRGIVGGATGIFLDGVRIQNPDGTYNFKDTNIQFNAGWPDQPILSGFAQQQAESGVSIQLKYNIPITRTIINENVDSVRLTVSVPALQYTKKDTGDISGTDVTFSVAIQSNGGGFRYYPPNTISGKTNTRYQRSYVYQLEGMPPWDILLARNTADSAVVEMQNDIYWDSFTEIIDARLNYTLSAVVGSIVDAEQFQTIPKRVYLVDGLYVWVPNNYDPVARTYNGVWDGNFSYNWTNNPAWVLYDLLRVGRYGIGDFISVNEIDRWSFYKVAQWCDGLAPNGRGGYEPRFVCNARITTQQEAFDLLNSMASVFRGFMYWAGGQLVAVADQPSDPVGQYTNANVIDGVFSYQGADIKARHNQCLVTWNDPSNIGEPRISIVEDQESISKFGIIKTDLIAIGCTSESQAIRSGRWLLYSESYESEVVTFKAGLDAAWARPGDIIQIADTTVSGEKMGGRVVSATASAVVTDRPVVIIPDAVWYTISCTMPDGRIETRNAYVNGTDTVIIASPFSASPLPDSVWVVSASSAQTTLWRVTQVNESSNNFQVEMTALRHFPDKWGYIENNLPLTIPDVSNIQLPTIASLTAQDYLVLISPVSIGVRMLISWESKAPSFQVSYRAVNGNWTRTRTDQVAIDIQVLEGDYEIEVCGIDSLGRRGPVASITRSVTGRYGLPADPQNFRIQVIKGIALFQWAPATDLDVIIGGSFELRYSPRVIGASWNNSNTILTSIPGTATTVEAPHRPGTYLLRTRDIVGLFSEHPAVVVSSAPDTEYRPWQQICEHPDWLGTHVSTMIYTPGDWLTLLPDENEGEYLFDNSFDMGGVFTVRLTVDMFAFPFLDDASSFLDSRAGLVDDWQSWDDFLEDGGGMVTIRVRQTDDDPAGTPTWSAWTQFISGDYVGRAFQFKASLSAPVDQNMAVENLCILADISNKVDQSADVAWVPNKMSIAFGVKFFAVPAISIAIQEGVEGDNYKITAKTRTGFDLELLDAAAASITGARTFDWIATGY